MKPLGHKAYDSIPHLPGSRLGSGDHHCEEGQARIATVNTRDKHDTVIVQEKLDGSCCAVAKLNNGQIVPLTRAGYPATTSQYDVHHDFAAWVEQEKSRFDRLLREGERVVGEYLAQAVGTRYDLHHEPFVVFDIMTGPDRACYEETLTRAKHWDFTTPLTISHGPAFTIENAMEVLSKMSGHGAIDPVEGAIWRVERKGKVDFLTKFVRHDKEDGKYFPEKNNGIITWNIKSQP